MGSTLRVSTGIATVLIALGAQLTASLAPSGSAAAIASHVYSATSSSNSDSFKGAFAECPAGERVVGGGARIVNGHGRVGLVSMQPSPTWPSSTPDVYYAWAQEHPWWFPEYTENWSVVAYAICVPSMPGLTYVRASSTTYAAVASCPSDKVVVGTGASVSYQRGHSLQWIRPMGVNGFAAHSVRVEAGYDFEGGSSGFEVGATANSASPPPGYEFLAEGTIAGHTNPREVAAFCPDGKSLLGGGLTKYDPYGKAQVDGVYPNMANAYFTTSAQLGPRAADELARDPESANSYGAWAIAAWVICANTDI